MNDPMIHGRIRLPVVALRHYTSSSELPKAFCWHGARHENKKRAADHGRLPRTDNAKLLFPIQSNPRPPFVDLFLAHFLVKLAGINGT